MIYTLTLNPSLDYIMEAPTLKAGETNRSSHEKMRYGGKGINVAAVLASLGAKAQAIALLGGKTGELLLSLAERDGLSVEPVKIAGDTRINLKILSGEVTELNAKGPSVSKEEMARLFRSFDKIKEGDTLVLSGSIAPLVPKDIYAQIARTLSEKGVRVVLDTSGEALLSALSAKPYLIKPNESEIKQTLGEVEILSGARTLQKKGARNVLVSLGADGAVLLTEDGSVLRQKAPSGVAKNTVGAGDSMLAGFLYAESMGAQTALRFAVAAGSATAFKGALASGEEIRALAQRM